MIIFSDIHGNGYSFDSFVLDTKKSNRRLFFLGDFIGYYYEHNEIISYCRENDVTCLLGNHDKYFLDVLDGRRSLEPLIKKYGNSYALAIKNVTSGNIDFLRSLKKSLELNVGGVNVFMAHGSPLDNLEGRIYPDTDLSIFDDAVKGYDYVITGHTHHKMDRSYKSTRFLNPGSLGQQRDGKGCSYLTIDFQSASYKFNVVDYDISRLEDDIRFHDDGRESLESVLRRQR